MFIYVEFTTKGKTLQAASLEAAKQIILHRYPGAYFGEWNETKKNSRMAAWPSELAMLRHDEDGDTSPQHKPRAYVCIEASERPIPSRVRNQDARRPRHVVCPVCQSTSNLQFLGNNQDKFISTDSIVYAYKCTCGASFSVTVPADNSQPAILEREPGREVVQ